MKGLITIFLLAMPCLAQSSEFVGQLRPQVKMQTSKLPWKISVAALAAAEAADVLSSRGRYETNPLAQGPGGVFSTQRGIAIKVSYTAPLVLAQWLLVRHHPGIAKAFTWANFGAAGFTGAIVSRNSETPRAIR